ncbi:hypothetical protein PHSY_002977 [Pseudozyma hubeiensis SY62]|uniref:Proteasome assembly chaperone 2 n=1 Tax=Pseudozyma hubeiensis (strain SY62) TaxID=1305764 RepID=R9P2H6_PSEHS|nr:hypothetical protein PHSY_002977 [Pseudozyma hubeiensis SY62]GAC95402.1 hypothetical protein PHSY_002977 [Pseudozyma hubeiensis SY62]
MWSDRTRFLTALSQLRSLEFPRKPFGFGRSSLCHQHDDVTIPRASTLKKTLDTSRTAHSFSPSTVILTYRLPAAAMTQTPFYTPIKPVKLDGTTLIIPAVSIGSVPQLAIDLLINDASLSLVKVGRIDPSFCFPFVGPSESAHSNDITTSLEGKRNHSFVHFSHSSSDTDHFPLLNCTVFSNGSLTVIQQHSPILKSTQSTYISALTSFLSSTRFTEILYLTSLDSAARTDDEFSTPLLSLFPPSSLPATTPIFTQLRAKFPAFNPLQQKTEVPHIPGSLLTRKLVQHVDSSDVKDRFGALLYFAAEGDTRSDAHALANVVLSLLPSSSAPTSLTDPPSWSALFGSPAAPSLYA